MKWAWAAVIVVIVLAGGIFVFRTVNAPDTSGVVVQTVRTSLPSVTGSTITTATREFVDPDPDQPTKVVNVTAVDKSGNPAAGYRVADGVEVANCRLSSSAIDEGVLGCLPGGAGANVCWTTPSPRVLLCGDGPWTRSLTRNTTDQIDLMPLNEQAQPWGMELADGAKCHRRNGGSHWPGRADGLEGAYSCDEGAEFVLRGAAPLTDRTKPAWTVKVGGMSADNASFPPPVDMRVVTAFFAASP
ncbi:hypothetical protein LX88_007353 [Lentzea californiensis]|nr:hypothetical protein [Lentzea californiensis]